MKTLITPVLLSLLAGHVHAQSIQWMRDAGSTPFSANERGDAVDTDADGNAYVLGHLSIDSQFSGLPVQAHQDGCVAKYNAFGTVQWVRTFGGPGFVDMQEAAVKVSSADNAVYVCGSFRTQFANPTVTFDTISFTFDGNSRHAFLAKYDLDGNIQWMRHGGGEGLGAGFNDLDIDDQGRIVVVGTTDGTNVFDGETLTYDGGLLARYLQDGTLSDLVQLNDGSAEHQEAVSVEVAPGTGNIHIAGAFFGTIALNGFTATAAPFSIWVMKLDDALSCQWLSTGGGNSSTYGSYPRGLAIDAAENSYITGNVSGELVSFGPHSFTGNSESDDEVFAVKYNSDGEAQWLRHGGSIRNDEAFDIIADAQGNTVITGLLGGNIPFAEFDGVQVDIVSQSTHCFIARYDANGQIAYAERLGGGSDDVGSGLALANDSTFFLTGTTWGSTPWLNWNFQSCCLDPNLFVAKFHDAFNDPSTGVGQTSDLLGPTVALTPNPANTTLWINGLPADAICEVFDASGSRIPCSPTALSVDVSAWPDGLYFLRTTNRFPIPFVVQH
ncbi:MAG: T9SS type A sorting domain-containing protein [Flavobacteriales bacterium]|nr:T9SS type A sorting domain-containing protein [Flavobacteriales bacterium]